MENNKSLSELSRHHHPAKTGSLTFNHIVTLPLMTQANMTSNHSSKLPPVTLPKCVSPSRSGSDEIVPLVRPHDSSGGPSWSKHIVVGLHDILKHPEANTYDRHPHHDPLSTDKAAANRRKALARRYLSNSLQNSKTLLPVLRRTQSFGSAAHSYLNAAGRTSGSLGVVVRRETASLSCRKPAHHDLDSGHKHSYDCQVAGEESEFSNGRHSEAARLRRTCSLREEGTSSGGNPNDSPPPHQLSLSLPPHLPFRNHYGGDEVGQPKVSLAALVHQLNATMHNYPSSPSRCRPDSRGFSVDDDEGDEIYDDLDDLALSKGLSNAYANGDLDPDLCPRLVSQGSSCDMPLRTLTPALRKLNKKEMSSRVRTQQWVNQLESDQHRNVSERTGDYQNDNNERTVLTHNTS